MVPINVDDVCSTDMMSLMVPEKKKKEYCPSDFVFVCLFCSVSSLYSALYRERSQAGPLSIGSYITL